MRNLCHVYMDYSVTYFVVSCLPLLLAIALARNQQEKQQDHDTVILSSPLLILTACIGGSLLSTGNLSMQWATAIYGAPLTTVLALQASMTVVLGTTLNYWIEPDQTPHPRQLWAGVGVFLAAILLATRAQMVYAAQRQQQQQQMTLMLHRHLSMEGVELAECYRHDNHQSVHGNSDINTRDDVVAVNESTRTLSRSRQQQHEYDTIVDTDDDDQCHSDNNVNRMMKDENGPSAFGTHQEGHGFSYSAAGDASPLAKRKSTTTGVAIAALGGLCFGFFSPCFNIAVNDPFHWSPSTMRSDDDDTFGESDDGAAFTVRIGLVNTWFSFAFFVASFVGNTLLLQRQDARGADYGPLPSVGTVLKTYLKQDGLLERQLAIIAGLICALGNILQFQGGQMCGYATADLVQAFPLVSTVWDMFLFGEFRSVKCYSGLAMLLIAMYVAYLSGIVLVASSSVL